MQKIVIDNALNQIKVNFQELFYEITEKSYLVLSPLHHICLPESK